MKKAKITYRELDKILRSLGFSCRVDKNPPPARVYEHEPTGALITLPTFPLPNRVYQDHMIVVRITLDNYGIPAPSVFDAALKKTG